MQKAQHVAFFDVDGTLINVRSLTSFLDFARERWGWNEQHWFRNYYAKLANLVRQRAALPRLNAFFYTVLRNQDVEAVAQLGTEWFERMHKTPGFYNEAMLSTLREHQANGDMIALVTGACMPLMSPLARYLGSDTVLCANLEVQNGVYTGALLGNPCIGQEKAVRASGYALSMGIPMDRCFAYGDDQSDVPLVNAVGSGHLMAPAQAYREELATRNWSLSDD